MCFQGIKKRGWGFVQLGIGREIKRYEHFVARALKFGSDVLEAVAGGHCPIDDELKIAPTAASGDHCAGGVLEFPSQPDHRFVGGNLRTRARSWQGENALFRFDSDSDV